jgi:magnesium transporter
MPENENPRFLYFSNLLGKRVTGLDGADLGRLADLVVATGEPYPPIESLVVRQGGKLLQLPWSAVKAANGSVQIDLGVPPAPLPETPGPDRIRLAEEILDRQIVDVKGAKLVRVNDLHFLEIKGALRLAHVDVSLRGLVRRLGWERIIDWTVALLRPTAPYLKAEHLLSWKLVQPIDRSPGRVRIEVAQQMLAALHPADLAEIMEELDRHQRELLFKRLDVETAAEALEETSEQVATELLEAVPPERAADILEEMAPDEAADALAKLPGDTRDELLLAMERPEAAEVQELLEYRPRSAGGLMTPDLVEVRPEATVADALAEVRRRAEELPMVYEVFVTDLDRQLKGVCTLKDLVVADPGTTLSKILHEAPATVSARAPLREVAGAAAKYNLLSVPVIDPTGVLLGMVTVDDILAEVVHAR